MSKKILYITICLLCIGCNSRAKLKEIILGDEKVVGNISKDTVFNGTILFFNKKTNELISESNYVDGNLEGKSIDYYPNGKVSSIANYRDDKLHGEMILFDQTGNRIKKENFYYNIRVGESINYKDKNVSQYNFFSLDGDLLFYLNYDSIRNRKITEYKKSFFFFHKRKYANFSSGPLTDSLTEVFLYMPSPPLFNFSYYLVRIDSSFQKENVIQHLNNSEPWIVIDNLKVDLDEKFYYAIKLNIIDSSNGDEITMYKKL